MTYSPAFTAPALTAASVTELAFAALGTPTMRNALGAKWERVNRSMRIRVSNRPTSRTNGSCQPQTALIKINLGPARMKCASYVLQTVMHEVCHLAPVQVTAGGKHLWHGKRFYQTLASVVDDLFGGALRTSAKTMYRRQSFRMYAFDSHLRDVFKAAGIRWISRNVTPVAVVKPAPVATPKPRPVAKPATKTNRGDALVALAKLFNGRVPFSYVIDAGFPKTAIKYACYWSPASVGGKLAAPLGITVRIRKTEQIVLVTF